MGSKTRHREGHYSIRSFWLLDSWERCRPTDGYLHSVCVSPLPPLRIVSPAKSNSNQFFFVLHMTPQLHKQLKCTSSPFSTSNLTDSTIAKTSISQLHPISPQRKQSPQSRPTTQPITSTLQNTPSNESISIMCGTSLYISKIIGVAVMRRRADYGILDSRGNGQNWKMRPWLRCTRYPPTTIRWKLIVRRRQIRRIIRRWSLWGGWEPVLGISGITRCTVVCLRHGVSGKVSKIRSGLGITIAFSFLCNTSSWTLMS